MFHDALRPSLDPTSSKFLDVPHVDGVIGSISQNSTKASLKQKYVSNTSSIHPLENPSNPSKTSEVNTIQSIVAYKASKGKKNGSGKEKI